MLKVVHSENSSEIVESTAEAVDLVWSFGSYVELLNPLQKGLTEIQRIIHGRVAAMDAPDTWPGARFEEDIVATRWVAERLAVKANRWCPVGHRHVKMKVDQVRA